MMFILTDTFHCSIHSDTHKIQIISSAGEFPGPAIRGISSSARNVIKDLALWQGAESWRNHSRFWALNLGIIFSSRHSC